MLRVWTFQYLAELCASLSARRTFAGFTRPSPMAFLLNIPTTAELQLRVAQSQDDVAQPAPVAAVSARQSVPSARCHSGNKDFSWMQDGAGSERLSAEMQASYESVAQPERADETQHLHVIDRFPITLDAWDTVCRSTSALLDIKAGDCMFGRSAHNSI